MNESQYPQEAKNQLKELRDAREEYTKVSNSLVVSDEDILNFDVKTATVINDKNEIVNKAEQTKKSLKSYTGEKTKELITNSKWYIIGVITFLLISIVVFLKIRKGGK